MQQTLTRKRPGRLAVALGLLLMAILIVGGMPSALVPSSQAATPMAWITPNQGHIHDLVVISGSGFRPGEDVFFSWGVHPFWGAVVDSNGNFTMRPEPVEWFAAYSNTITATGHSSGLKATTTFTLLK